MNQNLKEADIDGIVAYRGRTVVEEESSASTENGIGTTTLGAQPLPMGRFEIEVEHELAFRIRREPNARL